MNSIQVAIATGVTCLLGTIVWVGLFVWHSRYGTSVRQLVSVAIIAGIGCRIAFILATPIFYAPDEQAHFNYIRYLSEHRSFPVQTSKMNAPTNDWEYYQPPLYYLAMVPVYDVVTAVWHDRFVTVRVIRCFSLFTWLINVWLAGQFLRLIKIKDEFLRVATVVVICLLPTYTFLSSVINNDNLLFMLGGIILCCRAQKTCSMNTMVSTGFVLGLAMITKLTAVVYIPPLVLVMVIDAMRSRTTWRSVLGQLVLMLGIAMLIYAPWAIRNWHLYGSITAEHVANIPKQWHSWLYSSDEAIQSLLRSFWAVSGIYNNIYYHFPLLGIQLSVFSLAGLGFLCIHKDVLRNLVEGANIELLKTMIAAIVINILLLIRFVILYGQAQSRFLFPLLFPIALFFSIGLRPFPLKNRCIHITGLLILYTTTFTVFSLGMFTRIQGP